MIFLPDIEVLFSLNGNRKTTALDGYRPNHQIDNSFFTTGVHFYYGTGRLEPNGFALGTISFIAPEHYPHCLYKGKKIPILEGDKIVGEAIVLRIINPQLLQENAPSRP